MRIVALDPGETCGFALFDYDHKAEPVVLTLDQRKFGSDPGKITPYIYGRWLAWTERESAVLVFENYRVYKSKALIHVGSQLYTSELIGAILGAAQLYIPPVQTARIEASTKGRWPDKRVERFMPGLIHATIGREHARDAALIGLCYIEKELGWTPIQY